MRNSVWVFGAGVAGLTAAHELAERGFRVRVYDAREDPRRPGWPLIGGLAATQYRRWPAPLSNTRRVSGDETFSEAGEIIPCPWAQSDPKHRYWRWPLVPIAGDDAPRIRNEALTSIAPWLASIMGKSPRLTSGARCEDVTVVSKNQADAVAFARELADRVRDTLAREEQAGSWHVVPHPVPAASPQDSNLVASDADLADPEGSVACVASTSEKIWPRAERPNYVSTMDFGAAQSDFFKDAVVVYVHEQLLAGEHGYRFFPSFYRNLFDTLRRIPFLEPENRPLELATGGRFRKSGAPKDYRVDGENVLDRLVSLDRHALCFEDGRSPLELPRSSDRSASTMMSMLDDAIERLRLPPSDLLRMQATLLRYATSSRARRSEYEHLSWAQFSRSDEASDEFRRAMKHWPRALVGLSSEKADSRSFGSVQVQLLLDQAREDGLRDGSLDAPTSEAWLDPWRRYLNRHLGVTFHVGTLDSIDANGGVRRTVKSNAGAQSDEVPPDAYVVVALDLSSLLAMQRHGRLALRGDTPINDLRELERRIRMQAIDPPFSDFVGVQFFLEEDHSILRGHIYYPDSPWALTSVSPVQYRRDRPDKRTRAAGMVSVVIGDLDATHKKAPGDPGCSMRECQTKEEIARRVWMQIRAASKYAESPLPEQPLAFHIDSGWHQTEGADGKLAWVNSTPFLVNDVALADWWPETPGAYRVHGGRFAFAGTWLRTNTRLVTMEAACESGRHAANAILEHYAACAENAAYAKVRTFDLEDLEPKDLDWLRRLDAELVARGVPHLLDVLGGEDWMRRLDPGSDLASQLLELARGQGELGRALGDAVRQVATKLVPAGLRRH
jgi:uncharacterized protein with NAD-binding domain and iron-sulfur cluster